MAQSELRIEFRKQQQKYTYYLLALTVTAIGFLVINTADMVISYLQLPFGCSIIFWGLSISCGFNFIRADLKGLLLNKELLDVTNGRHKLSGTQPEMIKVGKEFIEKYFIKNYKRAGKNMQWQYRWFIIGGVSYLLGHIIMMHQNGVS